MHFVKRTSFIIPVIAFILTGCSATHQEARPEPADAHADTFYYHEPFLKVRTAVINSLKDARLFIKDAQDVHPNTLLLVARYEDIHTIFEPAILEINVYITEEKPDQIKVYAPKPDPKQFTARSSIERYESFLKSLRHKKLAVIKPPTHKD